MVEPKPTSGRSERLHHGLAGLLLFVVVIALFLPLLDAGYVLDDEPQLTLNPAVRELDLRRIFARGYWENVSDAGRDLRQADLYRPLSTLSLALGYRLLGGSVRGLHLENLLLHALAAWLVFGLLCRWRFSRGASWVGALLFAVAPVHIEPVASIVVRSELLAAIFAIGCLRCMASRHGPIARFGAPAACLLALLSKESAVAVLGLALLADLVVLRLDRAALRARVPVYAALLGVSLAYLLIRGTVLGRLGLGDPRALYFNARAPLEVWLTMARFGVDQYLSAALLGAPLVFDYSRQSYSDATASDLWAWLCLLGWLVLGAGAGYAALRRQARWTLGPLLFLIGLAPVSNLLIPIGAIGAMRMLYLPYLGVVIVLLDFGAWLRRRLPARVGGVALALLASALVCAYLVETRRSLASFAHSYTLARDILEHAPRNGFANLNAGNQELAFALARQRPPLELIGVSRREWLERSFASYQNSVRAFPLNWDQRPQNVIFTAFETRNEPELFELIDAGVRAGLPSLSLPPLPASAHPPCVVPAPEELEARRAWSRALAGPGLAGPRGAVVNALVAVLPDYCELRALHGALAGGTTGGTYEQRLAWRTRVDLVREQLERTLHGPRFPQQLLPSLSELFLARMNANVQRWLAEIEAAS